MLLTGNGSSAIGGKETEKLSDAVVTLIVASRFFAIISFYLVLENTKIDGCELVGSWSPDGGGRGGDDDMIRVIRDCKFCRSDLFRNRARLLTGMK